MIQKETYILNNGVEIPKIGLGTWQLTKENQIHDTMLFGLRQKFTHFDTAAAYTNEQFISRYIEEKRVKREKLFITSKLKAEIKGFDVTIKEFEKTICKLDTTYLDLYLIHSPHPWDKKGRYFDENAESFRAMIALQKAGMIKAIGVSNFDVVDLESLIEKTGVIPQVNQIYLAPFAPRKEIKEYCDQKGILVEAYSPLKIGKIFNDERMKKISLKYNKPIASIVIRWCLDYGVLPIPRSTKEEHIKELVDVDFTLEKEDFDLMMQED